MTLKTPEKYLKSIKSAESEDYRIGVTALIEKKEPEFFGK